MDDTAPTPFDAIHPDAADGAPEQAPLAEAAAKPKGFADPARRQAALDARRKKAAKRGAKRAKAADQPPAAAGPAQPASLDKTKAVHGALALTAQMTGDPRYLVVAEQHAPAIAASLAELAVAFDLKLDVDPRVAASVGAAVVAAQCWATFQSVPLVPPAPAAPVGANG